MERVAYRILKKLYRVSEIPKSEIDALAKSKRPGMLNKYVAYLKASKLVETYSVGGEPDGSGGTVGAKEYIRITLQGLEYVEKNRHDTFTTWVPWAVTSLIAVASLFANCR